MNAYQILESHPNSTQQEMKESYHKLLLKYHPDKQIENNLSTRIVNNDHFIKINSAFKLLSNPIERKHYDSLLKQAELSNKNSLNDDNLFILEKDFCLSNDCKLYTIGCDRCGGLFKLEMETKNELIRTHSNNLTVDSLVVCLQCENCSLTINVLIL
jgi:curved DNA-binding protein CbpA